MKKILLAALGTTPQIISEALYALMVQKKEPIEEVHLITTTTGKTKAEKTFFNNGQGPFYQFCRHYGFSATELIPKYHLIQNKDGEIMADIRTPADNDAAADFFLRVVRELTTSENTQIFATIAGGRKTMSAYLYFVMQLLGRPQDKLYHVLVRPDTIESNPGFFYPHPGVEQMTFTDKQGNPFSVSVGDIHIDMAEIPFVRLKRLLPDDTLERFGHFGELIAFTQQELDSAQFEPEITLDMFEKSLLVKGREEEYRVKLAPREMAVYRYLIQNGSIKNTPDEIGQVAAALTRIYADEYKGNMVSESSFHTEALQEIRSRINKKIKKQVKNPLLQQYLLIDSDRNYFGATYSVSINFSRVKILS
ncbi:MAG: CRISPR-associated ring nuclease Csm6 [Calditrichia bacterium]